MGDIDLRRGIVATTVLIWACSAATALACPVCPTGQAARRSVFDASFAMDLLLVMLPLLVLGLIAGLLYRIDIECRHAPTAEGRWRTR
jgi:hypothetical protein